CSSIIPDKREIVDPELKRSAPRSYELNRVKALQVWRSKGLARGRLSKIIKIHVVALPSRSEAPLREEVIETNLGDVTCWRAHTAPLIRVGGDKAHAFGRGFILAHYRL